MAAQDSSKRDERLASALAMCIESAENGRDLDQQRLLAIYPDFANELTDYLSCRQQFDRLVSPIRDILAPNESTRKVLGDFRIHREIGRGGMGVVYEAEQVSLHRRVALKVLPFASVLDERRLRRFKNEALAAAQLKHPNIVRVLYVGCDRGVHYYAMELIEGLSLAESLDAQQPASSAANVALSTEPAADRMRFSEVAKLGIQAAEALLYAHESGIVHRDIKPANLLMDGKGHLWVADFGLATTPTDAELTLTGDLLGTVRYMSPEQAAGNRAILDERTDIYSLGITLYELIARRPAFSGQDRQVLIKQIIEQEPIPLSSIDRTVPRDLETIILKATAKEPTERYASMEEFANDLRSFVDLRPISARRRSTLQRTSRWVQRHYLTMTTVTTFVIILAIVQGIALWREAALREQAEIERHRADLQTQRTWDVTFELLSPVFDDWKQLPKSYTLQRRALDRAIEVHRQRIETGDGKTPQTLLSFARLLLFRTDNSWQLGGDMEEDCETAISILQPLAMTNANSPARSLLSWALGKRGSYLALDVRFREAAREYTSSLRCGSADEQRIGSPNLVFALDNSGEPLNAVETAFSYLVNVRERERKSGSDWYSFATREEMAHPLVHAGRINQAEKVVREAIELTSRNAKVDREIQYWHGRALMTGAAVANESGNPRLGLERSRFAVELFGEQYRLAPELVWVSRKLAQSFRHLADALVCRSELDQAETALLESIHIYSRANARRDRFEVALTQFRLAQLYGTMGRENESTRVLLDVRDTFEDLARNSPDEPACVSKLVMLLTLSPDETSRDSDRAVELAERLPGTSGHFWRLRALAHYRAGLYQEAIERAERAMSQLEGGDSNDRFILAIAHWKTGNRDQARRWYREAIARMADGFPHLYHDLGPLAVRQLKSEAEILLADSASQSRVSTNRGGDAK